MAGCHKPADYSYKEPEFPVTEEVTITPVTTGEAISAQSFFAVYDTVAYIVANIDGKWLHTFSLNSGAPLGSYIPVNNTSGKIPGIDNFQINRKEGTITINQGNILFHYRIGEAGEPAFVDTADIPQFGYRSEIYELSGSRRLLVEVVAPDGLRMVKKIITLGISGPEYQNLDGTVEDIQLMNNGIGCYAVSPDGKRAAYMSGVGGIIQVVDISGIEIKPVKTMRYFPQEFEDGKGYRFFKRPLTLGFISGDADERYFYGAYYGDYVEWVDGKAVDCIGVWDWDGNPVKLYTTDKGILKIALSDDVSELYVVTYSDGDGYRIGKFPIHNP